MIGMVFPAWVPRSTAIVPIPDTPWMVNVGPGFNGEPARSVMSWIAVPCKYVVPAVIGPAPASLAIARIIADVAEHNRELTSVLIRRFPLDLSNGREQVRSIADLVMRGRHADRQHSGPSRTENLELLIEYLRLIPKDYQFMGPVSLSLCWNCDQKRVVFDAFWNSEVNFRPRAEQRRTIDSFC